MSLGTRLRTIRERRDFTQAALAERADIAAEVICHMEADRREPNAESLRRICRALDVTADYLLELGDETRRL